MTLCACIARFPLETCGNDGVGGTCGNDSTVGWADVRKPNKKMHFDSVGLRTSAQPTKTKYPSPPFFTLFIHKQSFKLMDSIEKLRGSLVTKNAKNRGDGYLSSMLPTPSSPHVPPISVIPACFKRGSV